MSFKSSVSRSILMLLFILCSSMLSISAMPTRKPQDTSKDSLLRVLSTIQAHQASMTDLNNLIWETRWHAVHGLDTSQLGGYKLASMHGSDSQYQVGICRGNIKTKTIIVPPVVVASWNEKPNGQQIIAGLRTAINKMFDTTPEPKKKKGKKKKNGKK